MARKSIRIKYFRTSPDGKRLNHNRVITTCGHSFFVKKNLTLDDIQELINEHNTSVSQGLSKPTLNTRIIHFDDYILRNLRQIADREKTIDSRIELLSSYIDDVIEIQSWIFQLQIHINNYLNHEQLLVVSSMYHDINNTLNRVVKTVDTYFLSKSPFALNVYPYYERLNRSLQETREQLNILDGMIKKYA